jgi:hypothetical protein
MHMKFVNWNVNSFSASGFLITVESDLAKYKLCSVEVHKPGGSMVAFNMQKIIHFYEKLNIIIMNIMESYLSIGEWSLW